MNPSEFQQEWPMPTNPLPIVMIGAGAIVQDAHLPAYEKWGLPVVGIYDIDGARAASLAGRFEIPNVFDNLDEAVINSKFRVFDLALPPQALIPVLKRLPIGCIALIQKPLGSNLTEAQSIARILDDRSIVAAVNFQMQYTPAQLYLNGAISRGLLGNLTDIEVHLCCQTPWEDSPYSASLKYVEIPLHSIHYLDWIRATIGLPDTVFALSIRHPNVDRADAKSSIILDYGPEFRCCLSLNHTHVGGPKHETAELRVEGTGGAAIVGLGYMLNQPTGAPESLAIKTVGGNWQNIQLLGERHPDAFAFAMANLQRFAAGEDVKLLTNINASLETMNLLDACLRSTKTRKSVIVKK